MLMRAHWLALVCAAAACSAQGDRPGIVVSPDMAYSIPFDPYDPHPHTRSGGTLMTPPEGTVPAGFEPFAFGPGREEADRAGMILRNPIDGADRAELARGKQVFDTFCAVCHGAEGRGDGPIIGRFPNPPSLLADRARQLPDGTLFHIITRGQGIMASYAVQVAPRDRWRAIRYIRKLQGGGQ